LWTELARRPALYHLVMAAASRLLGWAGGRRGRFRSLPLLAGWTASRDLPAPEGRTFHSLWREKLKNGSGR
jgi:L-lactate dehydrogenase complex protein LldF